MANKLKKSTPKIAPPAEKPTKTAKPVAKAPKEAPKEDLKKDRQEKIDLKKLARDERTWKIIGTVSLLFSIFLFIAFLSYFFTWKEDQSEVANKGFSYLFDNNSKVYNLLGRLGAYSSHKFISKGFGIASFLFCTFFFVVGINLLLARKVFSIWRNLKYVTFGLVIASVTLSFVSFSASFPFGGRV
ncbi:MAG TPA: DNA translocase FtsK 4TM domain-containing protein, partial [Chitinophagaceae bacterium]|nr:DNA translocase FtsK 4TM domain-containing protein [Chitinophagaceae bacterium]